MTFTKICGIMLPLLNRQSLTTIGSTKTATNTNGKIGSNYKKYPGEVIILLSDVFTANIKGEINGKNTTINTIKGFFGSFINKTVRKMK